MPKPIVAETERLIIRHLDETDISCLADMLADPEVMRFSVNGVMSRDATQRFLNWCQNLYSSKGYGSWAIEARSTSSFLGFAGLTTEVRNGREEVDVGYRLAQKYWKQGFATEATAKVLEYGFRTLGLSSISCIVLPDHIASIKVAEKVGFYSYETAETHGKKVRVYRLSSNEWSRQNA